MYSSILGLFHGTISFTTQRDMLYFGRAPDFLRAELFLQPDAPRDSHQVALPSGRDISHQGHRSTDDSDKYRLGLRRMPPRRLRGHILLCVRVLLNWISIGCLKHANTAGEARHSAGNDYCLPEVKTVVPRLLLDRAIPLLVRNS